MNVCFLNHILELGGGEIWALNTARRLLNLGHKAAFVCPHQSPLHAQAQEAGFPLYTYKLSHGSPFYEPLARFLERHEIDVLYCTVIGHYWEAKVLADVVERVNRERTSKRLVLILKTGLPPLPTATPEFYGAGVSAAIRRLHVVSSSVREQFLEWAPGMDPAYIEVSREGVDLDRFRHGQCDRAAARRQWHIEQDSTTVSCLARLIPSKGQDNLLLAAAEVLKSHPKTQFLLAGEGDDLPRLQQLAEHLKLNGSVRFLGKVEQVESLLAATDIVCHPSLADGLPNSLVEAMAMEKPVIASRVGGIPELLDGGQTGVLVAPHDVSGLVEQLGAMIEDRDSAARLGASSRLRVESQYDAGRNTQLWLERLAEEQAELDSAPSAVRFTFTLKPEPVPVLFLMQMLRTGGEETELGVLAKYLDRSRFKLLVASCYAANEPAPVLRKLKEAQVPVDTSCHGVDKLEDKLRHLIQFIRQEGVRVIVACQDTWIAYCLMHNLEANECRLIEHGGIVSEAARIPKDKTTLYLGVSKAIQEAGAARMPDHTKARYVPSMVDTALFDGLDRSTLRREFGIGEQECAVTFLGRLDPKKGLEHLIAAAAEIVPAIPQARFLIAGPPDAFQPQWADELREMAAPLAESGRFQFLGGLDKPERILAASDILVLPSKGEGMSHVISEAGAAGLAVIAFEDGAAAEQIEEGLSGRLIAPDRPDLLAPAIRELIGDAGLRKSLGLRLQEKVTRDYSAAAVIRHWEEALSEAALETRERTRAPAIIPQDGYLPFPGEIQIQTNTACNATCIMCPYPETSKELPNGRMSEELYRQILDECAREKGVWRLEPFLMNEPFTDTRMVDWIAMAKQAVPNALVTVTTNGTLMTPAITDRLINSGLDAIWFSFNGATKETYEQIMGVSFDKVSANIDYLLEVKPERLRVFTNMIETVVMAPEIEQNIRNWHKRGVGSGTSQLVNRAGNVKNFVELNYRPVNPDPVRICDLLFHKMYILYNGDAVICCMDWRRTVVMGNVKRQSIKEVWQGEKYQAYRRAHIEGRGKEMKLCNDCSYICN